MDGGRKPKRRIIDSTSVPSSRRTSYRQPDIADSSMQTRPLDDTPRVSFHQTKMVDNGKRDTEETKLSDEIQRLKGNVNNTEQPNARTIQYTKASSEIQNSNNTKQGNTGNEELNPQTTAKIKTAEGIKTSKEKHPETVEDIEQTADNADITMIQDAKPRTISNQSVTVDKIDENTQKLDDIYQPDVGTVDNTGGNATEIHPSDEIRSSTVKQTVVTGAMEQSTKSTLPSDTIRTDSLKEAETIQNKSELVESIENIVSTSGSIIEQQECICNHKDIIDPEDSKFDIKDVKELVSSSAKKSKFSIFGESNFETDDETDSGKEIFRFGNVKRNPLLSIPEDTEVDEVESIVFSEMFETKNIVTSADEISENVIPSGTIKAQDINYNNKAEIKFHEFFGDDEVLSSIVNDATGNSDIFDGNIKCQHGLSLFDDPKTIQANSKYFKISVSESNEKTETHEENGIDIDDLQTKDPYSIELELTTSIWHNDHRRPTVSMADLYDAFVHGDGGCALTHSPVADDEVIREDVYSSLMEGSDGTSRLLSVEEKWQIIFNERTRAPIYAVTQYTEYLKQFVDGHNAASRDNNDVIRKEGIHPISYLLRKLKLDLKMSYESFVEEFIKPESNGMGLLVKLLKSIQNTGTKQSGSANMTQLKNYKKTLTDEHDCLLCIKYSLRLKQSLKALFDINYGLETVSMAVISTYTKSRGTAIEILTVCLSAEEGFSRILDCFTYIQLKIGEPVRFKSLINMMNMDSQHNTIFKVSTMKFLNTLLDASASTNIRVFLQHELETAGLDIDYMLQKASGTGLEFDDLRRELTEWQRKYINVDTILSERGTIAHITQEPTNQKMIEELQTQVKKLTADKAYLEYQLNAVSTELRNRYQELQKRTPLQQHASTQCDTGTVHRKSVECQCNLDPDTKAHFRPAVDSYEWKDVYINDDDDMDQEDLTTSDDEGVVKVQHWLRSHCGSSENENKLLPHTADHPVSDCPTFYFKRNSLTRRTVRKTEFPGNWKLIPKSIEHFPSRFPPQQCHQTNCDRCDLRNRPENSDPKCSIPVQNFSLEVRLNDLVKNKKRSEVRSQSSDSAIGGSGEERMWVEKRIPLVPVVTTEADILQDLIQPDDSASACPTSEPYPDYSTINSKFETQDSLRTELSKVLREFEGSLLQYELPTKSKAEPVEHFISLGDI